MADGPCVAIVGAGASGTLTAVHLLWDRVSGPRTVALVEKGRTIGRGVAYSTRCHEHLLNVPAGRMSAFPGDPDHFVAWARRREPGVGPRTFLPRSMYGDYLQCVLDEAAALAAPGTRLVRVPGDVRAVLRRAGAPGAVLGLRDGGHIAAEHVVLATGNHPPAHPKGLEALVGSRRYVGDPWAGRGLADVDPGEPVLLVGAGLTSVDVALSLAAAGQRAPIVAISRHGLLPLAHETVASPAAPPALPGARLGDVVRWLRSACASGSDWQAVVDSLRPLLPALWAGWTPVEQERFLRHAARYWDVHRHRMAPAVGAAVDALMASGRLAVLAARVRSCESDPGGIDVELDIRTSGPRTMRFGSVVNCTGPTADLRTAGDPAIDTLFASGEARPGPHGMGIDVAADGAVLDRQGRPSAWLWAVGPLRKGRLWETTAVPEIRCQASALAHRLQETVAAPAPMFVRTREAG